MANPKPTVLDTNYLIRLVVRDVPKQTEAVVKLIESAPANSLIVSDVVFGEVVFVLEKVYEYDRQTIAKALTYVLEHSAFKLSGHRLSGALLAYRQYKKLSFVDCYALVQATDNGYGLLTFDRALRKVYTGDT